MVRTWLRQLHLITGILLAALVVASPAGALQKKSLGTYDNPVYVAVAPGYGGLLFVVEQTGRIQVLQSEVKLPTPFLNISNIVQSGGEQGLLSMAFPTDYRTSGKFYVAFNNSNGDIEVNEFSRSAANAARANANSRRRVIIIPHRDAGNHNGGQLQFGPDGYLYISTGDGGSTPEKALDLDSLLGKILRIDPHQYGARGYRIPSTNPFVGKAGRDEIYSFGLRNPWRFSVDGQDIAIADVGQGQYEEINFVTLTRARGANFGWPRYEGRVIYDNTQPATPPVTFPMHVYNHNAGGCAVIGGFVVRNSIDRLPNGRYFYGDACTGRIRSFVPNVTTQRATGDRSEGLVLSSLSGFGLGFHGRLYATQTSGEVSRLFLPP